MTQAELKILYDEYYIRILKFCINKVYRIDVAEDIAVDTFISVYNQQNVLPSEAKSYIFQAANNKCIGYIRREKLIHGHHKSIKHGLKDHEDQPDKERELEQNKILQAIKEGIEKLPRAKQIIFTLYAKGLSTMQICDRLNISVGNALNQKTNAINNIKKYIQKYV